MSKTFRARLTGMTFAAVAALIASAPNGLAEGKRDKASAKPHHAAPKAAAAKTNAKAGKTDPKHKTSSKDAKGKETKGKDAKGAQAKGQGKKAAHAGAKPAAPKPVARLPKSAPLPPAKPAAVAPRPRALASAVPMLIGPAAAATGDAESMPAGVPGALAYAPVAAPTSSDVETVKEALALARAGKTDAASDRKAQIRDLVGQKLVEWTILRSDSSWPRFSRYAAFVDANPSWPSNGFLRRRAEAQLWSDRLDPGSVLAFFSRHEPLSAKGHLAMARALLAGGERSDAQAHVREAWREESLSEDVETTVLDTFGPLLTRADHKARMDHRLYSDDFSAAMRAAKRLGGSQPAIVQAHIAVQQRAKNAGVLLEAVPPDARSDPAYIYCRIQWLRRNDRLGEAAQMMLSAPRSAEEIHDTDDWWVERRVLIRALLDAGNPQSAYRIARDAATPEKPVYRVEQPFTAGWIALRYLDDPSTAMRHFSEMAQHARNPIGLGRAGYWLGRAAEAAGRTSEARRHYEAAAQHATTYYGQLARARLGHNDVGVRRPPALSEAQRLSLRQTEVVRAVDLLYATGNRDLVITFVADAAERIGEPAPLAAIAEAAARHGDARAMLLIGKGAVAQGFAFDHYAFPNVGIPKFASIGPAIETSLVYSIARQESAFNQDVVSIAKAMGLMQVTPAAGRYIARKFNVTYNEKKLRHDPVYNTQMGSAEIADLVRDYDGNYAMAFAAYNAGRGRVREWIGRFGDPRNPDVDPIDWVERIPFSETRNYVQRVMENLQVYRSRFGQGGRLTIEADLRGTRAPPQPQ